MSHSNKIQTEKFYRNRSDNEKSAKNNDIEKTNGIGLIAKAVALKSLIMMTLSVKFQ